MKDQFKGGTQILTSNKDSFASFGKVSMTQEMIRFYAGFSTLEILKDQIIELRFDWGLFPRLTAIGKNGSEFIYGTIGLYRRKTGKRVYNAIEVNGYSITLERAKFGWIKASKEMNQDIEKYDLMQSSG